MRLALLCALLLSGCNEHSQNSAAPVSKPTEGFEVVLTSREFMFTLRSPNNSSLNTLTMQPQGLSITNRLQTEELNGIATEALLGDLDGNGFPEVYVFVTSAGSGSYGSVAAWAVNNGKSITPIYLPGLLDHADNAGGYAAGYMGHDQFSLTEIHLLRRFPIYRPEDRNAKPTGGHRTIRYGLSAGEASWRLEIVDWQDEPMPGD